MLHPSVQAFKEYVQKHPELIRDVRKGKTTWKQLYGEWYKTEQKEEESPSENMFHHLRGLLKNIQPEQIDNLSTIATGIQEIIQLFRGEQKE